jgi:two-component system, OmpR family, alkaline phosphatase synthesis response regulator PhoP
VSAPDATALVVVVEDDAAIAEGLALNLRLQGYGAVVAGDAEAAIALIETERPDLVLLDISLPKQSGIWVLENVRDRGDQVPVIVLSARQDEFDKVAALRLGADDYVTKPFALAELLARIAAVLRRARPGVAAANQMRAASEAPAPAPIRFSQVEIDPRARAVTREGKPIKLTHLEFELLTFFCRNEDRVFSRDELLRAVWGLRQGTPARTVDNFVAQLRAKLETDPDHPVHLLTVRGSGYRFVG